MTMIMKRCLLLFFCYLFGKYISWYEWLGKASGKVFRRRICEECALGEFASIVAVEFAERAIQRWTQSLDFEFYDSSAIAQPPLLDAKRATPRSTEAANYPPDGLPTALIIAQQLP